MESQKAHDELDDLNRLVDQAIHEVLGEDIREGFQAKSKLPDNAEFKTSKTADNLNIKNVDEFNQYVAKHSQKSPNAGDSEPSRDAEKPQDFDSIKHSKRDKFFDNIGNYRVNIGEHQTNGMNERQKQPFFKPATSTKHSPRYEVPITSFQEYSRPERYQQYSNDNYPEQYSQPQSYQGSQDHSYANQEYNQSQNYQTPSPPYQHNTDPKTYQLTQQQSSMCTGYENPINYQTYQQEPPKYNANNRPKSYREYEQPPTEYQASSNPQYQQTSPTYQENISPQYQQTSPKYQENITPQYQQTSPKYQENISPQYQQTSPEYQANFSPPYQQSNTAYQANNNPKYQQSYPEYQAGHGSQSFQEYQQPHPEYQERSNKQLYQQPKPPPKYQSSINPQNYQAYQPTQPYYDQYSRPNTSQPYEKYEPRIDPQAYHDNQSSKIYQSETTADPNAQSTLYTRDDSINDYQPYHVSKNPFTRESFQKKPSDRPKAERQSQPDPREEQAKQQQKIEVSDTLKQKKYDVVPPEVIRRHVWGALPVFKGDIKAVNKPVKLVVFSVDTGTAPCDEKKECIRRVKELQARHMGEGLADIQYNFLVGGDGNLYEGRGWDQESGIIADEEATQNYNFGFIGKYKNDPKDIPARMLAKVQDLLIFSNAVGNTDRPRALTEVERHKIAKSS